MITYYIDSYPIRPKTRTVSKGYYIENDMVEQVEEVNAPHPVLDGYDCPVCGKGFMSDHEVTLCYLNSTARVGFIHADCMSDEIEDVLESLGYDLTTDTGAWMEART